MTVILYGIVYFMGWEYTWETIVRPHMCANAVAMMAIVWMTILSFDTIKRKTKYIKFYVYIQVIQLIESTKSLSLWSTILLQKFLFWEIKISACMCNVYTIHFQRYTKGIVSWILLDISLKATSIIIIVVYITMEIALFSARCSVCDR